MSILAWHDALALCHIKRQFTHEEKAAGWPPAMEIEVLTYMQRPLNLSNEESPKLTQALYEAIKADCEKEAIPYGLKKRPVVIDRYWGDADFYPNEDLSDYVERTNPPKQTLIEDREFYTLTAAVFSSWLATNGRTPSVHIQEWFKSQGVALATAGDAAPVALLDSDGMMTPAALVQWRKQLEADGPKNNNRWPLLHVQSLAAWLRRECAENGESGALMRIAKQFGYPRSNKLRDVLKGKGFNAETGEEPVSKLDTSKWPPRGGVSDKTGT